MGSYTLIQIHGNFTEQELEEFANHVKHKTNQNDSTLRLIEPEDRSWAENLSWFDPDDFEDGRIDWQLQTHFFDDEYRKGHYAWADTKEALKLALSYWPNHKVTYTSDDFREWHDVNLMLIEELDRLSDTINLTNEKDLGTVSL